MYQEKHREWAYSPGGNPDLPEGEPSSSAAPKPFESGNALESRDASDSGGASDSRDAADSRDAGRGGSGLEPAGLRSEADDHLDVGPSRAVRASKSSVLRPVATASRDPGRDGRSLGVGRAELALAQAIIPGSRRVLPADEGTAIAVHEILAHVHPRAPSVWKHALTALSTAAVLRTGRPFHALDRERQQRLLEQWERDPALRAPLGLVALIYKFVHFDRLRVYEKLGGRLNVVEKLEQPRWLGQVSRGVDWVGKEDIEAEVVVVGTGAGGAVVGRELAERGFAVVFVEEGEHVRRDRFDGSSRNAHLNFYRAAVSLGNSPMPVFIGRLVGGSTAVNGGTCFDTPPWVLEGWCEALETDALAPEAMAAHFERVRGILGVAPAEPRLVGPVGDIIRRGAEAFGWSHGPILRNAPGCDGKGFCDFGCRTDARRSTNISYVPAALERGSMLISELTAERVLLEGRRAVGLKCRARGGGEVRIRAPTVILAGGAVPTPMFLLAQGICNESGQVGKNLSLHPSTGVSALMDERVDGMGHIPQGYCLDEFKREGLLITGAQPDYNFGPVILPVTGERLMRRMEQLEHIASFGVLIRDGDSRGRVRLGPGGQPLITYRLSERDAARLQDGVLRTAEMVRAAGAKEIYPSTSPPTELRSETDFRRFRDRRVAPGEFLLTSYHPLGTCRMGRDPKTSVVGLDHETHDVKGLYIVDGSTVPGPLGVNPQITIMALATRAAERIADRIA